MSFQKIIIEKFLSFKDISYKKSRWKEINAFFLGNREIAHFENTESIDIRLTKFVQKQLSDEMKKKIEFRFYHSDWITFHYSEESDISELVDLINLAIDANKNEIHHLKKKAI